MLGRKKKSPFRNIGEYTFILIDIEKLHLYPRQSDSSRGILTTALGTRANVRCVGVHIAEIDSIINNLYILVRVLWNYMIPLKFSTHTAGRKPDAI